MTKTKRGQSSFKLTVNSAPAKLRMMRLISARPYTSKYTNLICKGYIGDIYVSEKNVDIFLCVYFSRMSSKCVSQVANTYINKRTPCIRILKSTNISDLDLGETLHLHPELAGYELELLPQAF